MYSENWRKHFRYSTFRGGQESALEEISKALDSGQKYIIAELPTGLGKSDIAMALAKVSADCYVTTSQKILQDQYNRDFEKDLKDIRGKDNYKCKENFEHCKLGEKAKCLHWRHHAQNETYSCTYKEKRNAAIEAEVAIMNSTYYATALQNTDLWPIRKLVVLDEAHSLAGEIMKLVSLSLNDWKLSNIDIELPCYYEDFHRRADVSNWKGAVAPIAVPVFKKLLDEVDESAQTLLEDYKSEPNQYAEEIEELTDLVSKIAWFERSMSSVEWIVDYSEEYVQYRRKVIRKVEARPLDTAYFAKSLLFSQGQQFVLQSATIVDFERYAAELGIKDYTVVKKPPVFPLKNRPVYPMAIADMSYRNIDQGLKQVASAVVDILKAFPDDKGIIHTGSYKVWKYLKELNISDRLIFPTTNERSDAIEQHTKSLLPTVLVSPSMQEGVDLKDELGRWAIICKIPYADLSDRRVKLKSDRDRGWYTYDTAKKVVQSVGRIVRSEKDWGYTFVLDNGFRNFCNRANLDNGFTDAIRNSEEGWKVIKEGYRPHLSE